VYSGAGFPLSEVRVPVISLCLSVQRRSPAIGAMGPRRWRTGKGRVGDVRDAERSTTGGATSCEAVLGPNEVGASQDTQMIGEMPVLLSNAARFDCGPEFRTGSSTAPVKELREVGWRGDPQGRTRPLPADRRPPAERMTTTAARSSAADGDWACAENLRRFGGIVAGRGPEHVSPGRHVVLIVNAPVPMDWRTGRSSRPPHLVAPARRTRIGHQGWTLPLVTGVPFGCSTRCRSNCLAPQRTKAACRKWNVEHFLAQPTVHGGFAQPTATPGV